GAGTGGGARAAVGLQHVAVHRQRALPELLEIHHRAQRTTDQTLDLMGAPGGMPAGRLARRALVRGSRQHGILGGDPALALAEQERWDALLDRDAAGDAR